MWETNGERFSVESPEVYADQAKAWLGDNTELRGKTIEEADWPEIYQHFKAQREAE